jgi:hypothetical protein
MTTRYYQIEIAHEKTPEDWNAHGNPLLTKIEKEAITECQNRRKGFPKVWSVRLVKVTTTKKIIKA